MIYQEPELTDADEHVLGLIKERRERLGVCTTHNPRQWSESLRKTTLARTSEFEGRRVQVGWNALRFSQRQIPNSNCSPSQ